MRTENTFTVSTYHKFFHKHFLIVMIEFRIARLSILILNKREIVAPTKDWKKDNLVHPVE